MDKSQHRERVYAKKSPEQMSWHAPHLADSLDWISRAAPNRHAAIIDVGGGSSSLAHDLLANGYDNVTVADISRSAIEFSQARTGSASTNINWIIGDITAISLPEAAFDIWHDRAVYHFLVDAKDRVNYRRRLTHALKPSGQFILAVISLDAPSTCSGLKKRNHPASNPHRRHPAISLLPIRACTFLIAYSSRKSDAPNKKGGLFTPASKENYTFLKNQL